MRWFTTRLRITAGLAGLMMLIYLGATVAGLFPNEEQLVLKGRAALCENIAVNSSLLVKLGAWGALKSTIDTDVARSPELLSVGVRNKYGKLISDSERPKQINRFSIAL